MARPQHLCIRPLLLGDVSQVLALEMAGFPPHERALPRRIEYRLTVCPELCSGLFVREFDADAVSKSELPTQSTVCKETLIGHVIGTKMASATVTNEAMEVPASFQSVLCNPDGSLKEEYKCERLLAFEKAEQEQEQDKGTPATEPEHQSESQAPSPAAGAVIGHTDAGKTIGIHSVVTDPEYRGKKLASLLLKDYLQRMNQQYVADSVALLCKDHLVPFYSNVGFKDAGVSSCRFAGEEWHDMTVSLDHDDDDDDDE